MREADIYKALGDPIRLKMVKRLSVQVSSTVGELSENLGISRQGARKQLQVLVDTNIVHLDKQGRTTKVTLDMHTLKKAQLFISQLEKQWEMRLASLKQHLEKPN